MSLSPIPISLLRYLIVWKVNSSLAVLPECLPIELSLVLGTIIANRLATQESSPWRKTLTPLAEYYAQASVKGRNLEKPIPNAAWPLEAVLSPYPVKRVLGQGELLIWELKLLGESADHGFFLELILPAMEEASYTSDNQWNRPRRLWGHFDVSAVYAAKGQQWEPVVQDGRLNLRYRPTPIQWAEGLPFTPNPPRQFSRLHWLTTFDLPENGAMALSPDQAQAPKTLQVILAALIARANHLLPGKHKPPEEAVMAVLNPAKQAALQSAWAEAARTPRLYKHLQAASPYWPGAWSGSQTYAPIAISLIPYLELASILHIGTYTHFGCGTFKLG
jgi:hypothetical protein